MITTYELYRGRQRGGKLLAVFPAEHMATKAVARALVVEDANPKGYRGVYTVVRVDTERIDGEVVIRRGKRRTHARPRSDVKMAILRLLGASYANRNPEPAEGVQGPPVQRPDDVWSLRTFLGHERSRSADLSVHADAGT